MCNALLELMKDELDENEKKGKLLEKAESIN